MSESAPSPKPSRNDRLREVASWAVVAGAVFLGWQVMLQPVLQRGPAEAIIRLAPGSPLVLRRAAESELIAGDKTRNQHRWENAAALSRDALVRSPFDVRALRVVGLTEARAGREPAADDILTLAGNWSLRDDPTHAWLVEYRLRQGDYASSFAHADTLARRREDLRPNVFQLFTVAADTDPQRALPQVATLLAARPPWRQAYLDSLYADTRGLQVAMNLAVLLQSSKAPLNNDELRQLYLQLVDRSLVDAVRTLRARLNRPSTANAVTNGDFGDASAPEPFQWRFDQGVGVVAEIVPDDLRPANPALRIEYDGYAATRVAEQLMFLAPGRYRLTGESRAEAGDPAKHLGLAMLCAPGDLRILSAPASVAGTRLWTSFRAEFTVPASCPAQWLMIEPRPGDKREHTLLWIDHLAIAPIPQDGN